MEGKLSEIIKEIKSKKDKKPRSVNKGGRPKASLKRSNHLTVMCTIMEKKIIQMNARMGVSEICYTLFRGKLTTLFAGKEMHPML